uniref:FHA domain-containing protein n=1 Tax=Arcella intermedia TaxID=1963864 RepID=A0A6B2LH50_9EUKA
MWRPDMSPNAKRKSEIDNRRFKAWKEKKERIKANKEAEEKAILEQQEAKEPWGKNEKEKEEEEDPDKEKPNFEPSGALLSEFKTKKGVELKYVECPEAKKPTTKWRLYPCKDDKILDPYKIHQHSMYLLGRDRRVVDIPLDHPSCGKQHAVLQYRSVEVTDEDGQPTKITKPYIIDLNSTNGTFLNGTKIDAQRYIELMPRDVLRFGYSTREFVLLHEGLI